MTCRCVLYGLKRCLVCLVGEGVLEGVVPALRLEVGEVAAVEGGHEALLEEFEESEETTSKCVDVLENTESDGILSTSPDFSKHLIGSTSVGVVGTGESGRQEESTSASKAGTSSYLFVRDRHVT